MVGFSLAHENKTYIRINLICIFLLLAFYFFISLTREKVKQVKLWDKGVTAEHDKY